MPELIERGRTYYLRFYCGGRRKKISLRTDSLQIAKQKKRQHESGQACGIDNPLA
ncbi:MAG: hypothetical protein IT445_08655 [Phycisphaeraceae bacterium]|nr:hypothetical protein [Phycisphaeraceae bacterium]